MDKLFEAIDRYNEDKNEMALYENIINTGINFNEMQEVLKDTLGEKYNINQLVNTIDNDFFKEVNGGRPLSNEDFE